MRGLVLEAGRARVRDDLPEPTPGPDETLVEVILGGVCATDLALRAGYMGFHGIPGHEFVGRALDGPLAGQRVVGEINAGCGRCTLCRAGDPRHCTGRTVLGILGRPGAFAERIALPTANLLPVPEGVPDEAAVFVEPLAAALQIPAELQLDPVQSPSGRERSGPPGLCVGSRALVAGDGRLGLLCAHALHEAGLRVTVAGHHEERADLLPQGVPLLTGLLEEGVPAGEPYPLAVDATGHPAVLSRLLAWLAPRGTLVLKTTTERPVTLDLAMLVVNEQRLIGSRCGRFQPALELLSQDRVPVERFVHARYPLPEADRALEHAARPGVLKVLVDIASC
jgi:threonine dehydrogenase-like Zn-dependent dehydrogenase